MSIVDQISHPAALHVCFSLQQLHCTSSFIRHAASTCILHIEIVAAGWWWFCHFLFLVILLFLFWSKGGVKEELMRGKVSPSCFPLPVRFLENERQTGWKTREHAGTHVHLNNVLAIGLILHQFVVSLSLCQTAPIVIHRIGHSLTPEWTCDSIVKFTHRWCLHSRIIVHITF